MKNKAFTLAEVMIVLSVIGILTAILLPVTKNAMPNKNIVKFKKAHNALYSAIHELVISDKYYFEGDLGIKSDGSLIDGTHANDYKYFCNSMADVINAKNVECKDTDTAAAGYRWTMLNSTSQLADDQKENFDTACMRQALEIKGEIITEDNVLFCLQENVYVPAFK